ncbi:MAG: ABC transporter permease [Planctomycetota bacterium]|jgi:ABC-2 type transport system permease protein
MTATVTLVQRELLRFFRQRNRVAGAVIQPVIFWVLFSAGFSGSFRPSGDEGTFSQFLLPGMASLIVLFTAIFSTISIIRDRGEGFLQGVLVAPVSRMTIVWGKVLGGTILAVMQATLFLLLGNVVGHSMGFVETLASIGILTLMGIGLTGLGFMMAWPMDSIQGFHAIMSVFMFPMWLLSGAIFPIDNLPKWFGVLVHVNPLTYGVSALRHTAGLPGASPSLPVCLAVTVGFAVFTLAMSARAAAKPAKGDLR